VRASHFVTEPLTDGPQARGFRSDIDFLRKVSAVDDQSEALQCDVFREVLVDELFERTSSAFVLMWIARTGRVEADGSVSILNGRDRLRFDERDLRGTINEAPDQPGGRSAVDVNSLAGDPLHFFLIFI